METAILSLGRSQMETVVQLIEQEYNRIQGLWTQGKYTAEGYGQISGILMAVNRQIPECRSVTYSE